MRSAFIVLLALSLTLPVACGDPLSVPSSQLIFAPREMTAARPFAIQVRSDTIAVIGQLTTGEGGYRLRGVLSRPGPGLLVLTVRPEVVGRGQRIPHLYGYEAIVQDLPAGGYRLLVRHGDTSGGLDRVWDAAVRVP